MFGSQVGEIRDCNPGAFFSIPGFGIGKIIIPGSRRDYRQVVIISCIMIVTIYIGYYNKLNPYTMQNNNNV